MSEQLFLIAHIAGRGVAIDSAQVESVVDIGHVTPTPRVAKHIRGLAALRSRVVTVIDTHAALGLPPIGIAGSRAVITVIETLLGKGFELKLYDPCVSLARLIGASNFLTAVRTSVGLTPLSGSPSSSTVVAPW